MKDNNISIIGCGFVGRAIYHGFSPYFDIKIYDKYIEGFNTLEETVNHSEVIFICVPTPVNENNEQDLSNIYDVINSIKDVTSTSKILVLKSTILPGTTRNLYLHFHEHFDFIFNPEFLTERTSINDFLNQSRIILGCLNPDEIPPEYPLVLIESIYRERFKSTPIIKVSFEEAELVKYVCNCYFSTKVLFLNEIYNICKEMGLNYENVRQLFVGDQRITDSHTKVPGFDGFMGVGGKCLPKDMKSFITWCEKNNYNCSILKTVDKVNEKVREKKDWLEIKGATSENNYGKE